MNDNHWYDVLVSVIASSAMAGVLVAWLNRRKTSAETDKARAESTHVEITGAIEVQDAALVMMHEIKTQLDELRAKHEVLRAEHDQLRTDHAFLKLAFAQEEQTTLGLEAENKKLHQQLHAEEDKNKDLLRRLELLEKRVAQLEAENRALRGEP